jgi:hypothetical protein
MTGTADCTSTLLAATLACCWTSCYPLSLPLSLSPSLSLMPALKPSSMVATVHDRPMQQPTWTPESAAGR